MEGVDPESLFEDVKEEQNRRTQNATEVIEWFLQEENIGEMYPRSSIVDEISDELSLPATQANVALSDVVGDIVDPLQQILREGERYVGIIEYREYPSEGAYGYIDFDDKYGERKRVVCARCVETEEFDDNISHATEGEGSVPDSASWNQLLNTVTSHYTKSHTEAPANIEVGASLLSGTTIAGNESWHAGNDGSGSGLSADSLRNASIQIDGTEISSTDTINFQTN